MSAVLWSPARARILCRTRLERSDIARFSWIQVIVEEHTTEASAEFATWRNRSLPREWGGCGAAPTWHWHATLWWPSLPPSSSSVRQHRADPDRAAPIGCLDLWDGPCKALTMLGTPFPQVKPKTWDSYRRWKTAHSSRGGTPVAHWLDANRGLGLTKRALHAAQSNSLNDQLPGAWTCNFRRLKPKITERRPAFLDKRKPTFVGR